MKYMKMVQGAPNHMMLDQLMEIICKDVELKRISHEDYSLLYKAALQRDTELTERNLGMKWKRRK